MRAFRCSRPLLSSFKHSTGLVGLEVNPRAREDAKKIYNKLLKELEAVPSKVPYRLAVERVAKHRLSLIDKHEDQKELEDVLEMQLEEIIEEAKSELELLPLVLEDKPWEVSGRKVEFKIKE